MSDLLDRARKMALPDPYDERDDPNWMLLMRELIERIEALEQERIPPELWKRIEGIILHNLALSHSWSSKANDLFRDLLKHKPEA